MISAKEAEKIVGEKLEPKLRISYPCSRKVVFLPEHPNMKSFFNQDYCYVLVHPGFSCQEEHSEYIKKLNGSEKPYGSYARYAKGIRDLIKNLENSKKPSVFLIGFNPLQKYPRRFLPPERSFILLTEDGDNRLLDSIEIENSNAKRIRLEQHKICSYLKRYGVNEVRMAGEWTWWKDNNFDRGIGCVRQTAREFEREGFEIKSVKGCLYPSFPPTHPIIPSEKEYTEVTRNLFGNQVEFTS